MLTAIITQSPAVGNSLEEWLLIAVSAVGVIGGGTLVGMYKAAKTRGVRDDRQDRVANAVLGDPEHPERPGIIDQVRIHGEQLAHLVQATSSNGLGSQQVGDTAARIERDQRALMEILQQSIGANEEAHKSMRRKSENLSVRLRKVEERTAA